MPFGPVRRHETNTPRPNQPSASTKECLLITPLVGGNVNTTQIAAYVVSGIGFLAGGVIFKERLSVSGGAGLEKIVTTLGVEPGVVAVSWKIVPTSDASLGCRVRNGTRCVSKLRIGIVIRIDVFMGIDRGASGAKSPLAKRFGIKRPRALGLYLPRVPHRSSPGDDIRLRNESQHV